VIRPAFEAETVKIGDRYPDLSETGGKFDDRAVLNNGEGSISRATLAGACERPSSRDRGRPKVSCPTQRAAPRVTAEPALRSRR
jgi:hypothetical protein